MTWEFEDDMRSEFSDLFHTLQRQLRSLYQYIKVRYQFCFYIVDINIVLLYYFTRNHIVKI